MRKIVWIIFLCLPGAMILAGCGKKLPLKEKTPAKTGDILVEYLGGGGGEQLYEESCFRTIYRVTTDQKIYCYLECTDIEVAPEKTDVFTIPMPEDAYREIERLLKKRDILQLDPKEDRDVCDGYSYYFRMYDENNELIGKVGGYMPTDKTLEKIRTLLLGEISDEERRKIQEKKRPYLRY